MAKGTDFGGVHSWKNLHLIQQLVDEQPAEPKLNLIDVPGANGYKDLSEQPAGRISYNAREITWTFALYPEDKWEEKHREVSCALNGRSCRITLDSDPSHYYMGRLIVSKYKKDKLLRQIIIKAICQPYMLKQQETTVSAALSTSYTTLTLNNECKPVVPSITVTTETTILWKGNTRVVTTGTYEFLDIELQEGTNSLQAKVSSGTGNITITYQEGAL